VYIYSSLFREFGGDWFKGGKLAVNGPEAEAALAWYVNLMRKFAPAAAQNWNWPDIADAFSQGTVASYIDAHSSASVVNNAEKSKVIGKVAYARWPKGPSGKRVSSIWNWGFPINAALTDKRKKATWLFIQWAASEETQARTAHRFAGPAKRSGVNRTSMWRDPAYVEVMRGFGDNFVDATLASLQNDTDVDWRPRVPQWPAVGDTLATAIQSALAGPGDRQGRPRRGPEAHRADDARLKQRGGGRLRPGSCPGELRHGHERSGQGSGPARALVRGRAARAGVRGAHGDHDIPAHVPRLDERLPHRPRDAVRGRLRRPRQLPRHPCRRAVLVIARREPRLHRDDCRPATRHRPRAGAVRHAHEARAGAFPSRGDPAGRPLAGGRRHGVAHVHARAGVRRRRLPRHHGRPRQQNWLGDPTLALVSVVAIHTWQWAPFAFMVLLASLAALPEDIYEAARLDRANAWQRFRRITLPLLRPAIVMVVIMRTMVALTAFAAIFTVTGGGPGTATEILNLYVYRKSFTELSIGYGAALAVALLVVTILISAVLFLVRRAR
jgi:hypothetical protein